MNSAVHCQPSTNRETPPSLRSEGLFTPPSLHGTLVFPGSIGGVNWGSAAFDPRQGVLVANTNRIAFELRLIPRDKLAGEQTAARNRISGEFGRQAGTPYAIYRDAILSPGRRPCNPPPWG